VNFLSIKTLIFISDVEIANILIEFLSIFICPFPSYPRELVLSIPSVFIFLIEDISQKIT